MGNQIDSRATDSVGIEAVHLEPTLQETGTPLAPWTYHSAELFELEQAELFRGRWQFAGHVSEVSQPGDYTALTIGGSGVFVIRGDDERLRAFKNVCRHRASRLLEGEGNCEKTITCPYHGWSYHLDGRLRGIPSSSDFPGIDKEASGLLQVELETFHGLVFVRVEGSGPTVAESFAETGAFFAQHGVADYEPVAAPSTEIWELNWKVAFDNYLENYHIPLGHPGLNRLLREQDESVELSSGVSLGVFALRDKPSSNGTERRYQELLHHADQRLPDALQSKWLQYSFSPNHGIDLYPELLDVFQLIPLDVGRTLVKTSFYGHRDATPREQELRELNLTINSQVNQEDHDLCRGIQEGLATVGYEPGPLSLQESCIHYFHNMIRNLIPVAALPEAPLEESLTAANERLRLDLG